MRSINFDDGNKSFCINDDESRVIRFNPGDLNITVRALEAQKRITEYQGKIKDIKLNPDGTVAESDATEEACDMLKGFDDTVRRELNFVFNADVYDTVFAGQSPLCLVGGGKEFLFMAFLESAMEIIGEAAEAFARDSQERIDAYTKEYTK